MHPFTKQRMQLREAPKRRDARFWNKIEETFHDQYVEMDKYETVERSECVARFLGKVTNGAGSIYNYYCPRILVG